MGLLTWCVRLVVEPDPPLVGMLPRVPSVDLPCPSAEEIRYRMTAQAWADRPDALRPEITIDGVGAVREQLGIRTAEPALSDGHGI